MAFVSVKIHHYKYDTFLNILSLQFYLLNFNDVECPNICIHAQFRGGSRNLRRGVLLKECVGARRKFVMTMPTFAKPRPFSLKHTFMNCTMNLDDSYVIHVNDDFTK